MEERFKNSNDLSQRKMEIDADSKIYFEIQFLVTFLGSCKYIIYKNFFEK